ncbi:MAG TPA: DUF3301 domain-containing protein [Steroidobacteraceae bacterium]|jgi:hypothetical protein
MELGWGALILLAVVAALAWFWQDSLAAREQANRAAMEACSRLGLQFLDGTVAFARLSLTRQLGWLKFRRTYVFDYTANSIERRQGFVVLTGTEVETVGYAPDETPRPAHVEKPPPPQTEPGKIIDFEELRRRRELQRGPPAEHQDRGKFEA